MTIEFEPKNRPITLRSSRSATERITFVQNLYDKAHDKVIHFDKLRHQVLNFAIVVFSALLAFVLKEDNISLQVIGCVGVAGLMVIFRYVDHRYHTYTHGFSGSMFVFNQVIAQLLNNPEEDISFFQYHTPSEEKVQQLSLQTIIYFALGVSALVLGVYILITGSYANKAI